MVKLPRILANILYFRAASFSTANLPEKFLKWHPTNIRKVAHSRSPTFGDSDHIKNLWYLSSMYSDTQGKFITYNARDRGPFCTLSNTTSFSEVMRRAGQVRSVLAPSYPRSLGGSWDAAQTRMLPYTCVTSAWNIRDDASQVTPLQTSSHKIESS